LIIRTTSPLLRRNLRSLAAFHRLGFRTVGEVELRRRPPAA
jgi:hypothetical protein